MPIASLYRTLVLDSLGLLEGVWRLDAFHLATGSMMFNVSFARLHLVVKPRGTPGWFSTAMPFPRAEASQVPRSGEERESSAAQRVLGIAHMQKHTSTCVMFQRFTSHESGNKSDDADDIFGQLMEEKS